MTKRIIISALLLNEVRGGFVAYYAVQQGAFTHGLSTHEWIMAAAMLVLPLIGKQLYRRYI